MAFFTVTGRVHNVIGNKREEIGNFTAGAVTDGEVRTKLYMIESLDVIGTNQSSSDLLLYKNSLTASTTEDDGGDFHMAEGASNAISGLLFQYRAVGW